MPSNPRQLPTAQIGALVSPFFYQDNQHTFFVEPTLTETPINLWVGWVVTKPKLAPIVDIEQWRQLPIEPVVPHRPIPIPNDPIAKYPIKPIQDWMVNPGTILQLGDTFIGQQGGINPATLPAIGNVRSTNGTVLQGEGFANANVQLGGEIASANPDIALIVIDSGGLNSAVLETINANLKVGTINSRITNRLMRR